MTHDGTKSLGERLCDAFHAVGKLYGDDVTLWGDLDAEDQTTLEQVALSFTFRLSDAGGWRPIESHVGSSPVLVGRPPNDLSTAAAFLDATGVWRVYLSEGGMTPLPFVPTVWQPFPAPPSTTPLAEGEGSREEQIQTQGDGKP